ncbi:hypothetical protein [Fodinibius sp. Rm-B-1B1-1]|uniref:hypothetical protein n=1 Tax=Fodinibius alkaliphilus TaxID=3140241 RepID=UPI003159BDC5
MIFSINILTEAVLIGIISSLTAAFITWGISILYKKLRDWLKFKDLAGTYDGYGYQEDTNEWSLKDEPQSKATINRIRKNILEIQVMSINKNGRYIWKGTIFMDSENQGSISWRYIKWGGVEYGNKRHKFGYKKITIVEDDENIYFYLSPEPNDGFDKAVFIKNT